MGKTAIGLKLVWIWLGAFLTLFGIYIVIQGILSFNSITSYYSTYIGQLNEQLHPNQYTQAFEMMYVFVILGIAMTAIGIPLFVLMIKSLKKEGSGEVSVNRVMQNTSELSRVKLLFERGDISKEAYDMEMKRLQK